MLPRGAGVPSLRMEDKHFEDNEKKLQALLLDEANKYCADCGVKGAGARGRAQHTTGRVGTRWASWNLGVFLCIKCGGMHRKMGTHVSKIKSVTLDKWTDAQLEVGNTCAGVACATSRARAPLEHAG